jgi:hypothetical protein
LIYFFAVGAIHESPLYWAIHVDSVGAIHVDSVGAIHVDSVGAIHVDSVGAIHVDSEAVSKGQSF